MTSKAKCAPDCWIWFRVAVAKAYGVRLKEQPTDFIKGINVATLDLFRGYANAIDEQSYPR